MDMTEEMIKTACADAVQKSGTEERKGCLRCIHFVVCRFRAEGEMPKWFIGEYAECVHYKAKSVGDAVDPDHYKKDGKECIDVMLETFGAEDVMAFCRCNIFKYTWRHAEKNGIEDLKKAEWYRRKLGTIATLEKLKKELE